jgi:hypothetical protein
MMRTEARSLDRRTLRRTATARTVRVWTTEEIEWMTTILSCILVTSKEYISLKFSNNASR